MESKTNKTDPLALLPDVPILEIARQERVSNTAIENAIVKLKVSMTITPTGRKTVSPADAIRLVEDMRARLVRT